MPRQCTSWIRLSYTRHSGSHALIVPAAFGASCRPGLCVMRIVSSCSMQCNGGRRFQDKQHCSCIWTCVYYNAMNLQPHTCLHAPRSRVNGCMLQNWMCYLCCEFATVARILIGQCTKPLCKSRGSSFYVVTWATSHALMGRIPCKTRSWSCAGRPSAN